MYDTTVVYCVLCLCRQEYCDCGTLAAIASEWRHEPESDQKMLERLALLQDCARGLQELHSRNVVHGDLVSEERGAGARSGEGGGNGEGGERAVVLGGVWM